MIATPSRGRAALGALIGGALLLAGRGEYERQAMHADAD
jgi:hypothetical protein